MNVCLCGAHTAGVRELGTFEGTQQFNHTDMPIRELKSTHIPSRNRIYFHLSLVFQISVCVHNICTLSCILSFSFSVLALLLCLHVLLAPFNRSSHGLQHHTLYFSKDVVICNVPLQTTTSLFSSCSMQPY